VVISPLVACASSTAMPHDVVGLRDLAGDFADGARQFVGGAAAVFTPVEASFDASTALSARCEV
jgi:hypothetical protein